ncbi:DUF7220 family protein [Aliarcobacter butzleri]|uniref:DUF7220 family protein n=1 Tax=Aliarcobacter butzleri TaxID=28197 RepID=UPI0021B63C1C|nr:hypothetical protein [Aliarcobacter butzleri]MCT7637054.1 hypothetical protein [Aliarcobacter butzleri]
MQTKRMSLIETVLSVLIGYIVALLSQIVVFPLFDIEVSLIDNLLIGLLFTVISIIRGYYIRRLFNWIDFNRTINTRGK